MGYAYHIKAGAGVLLFLLAGCSSFTSSTGMPNMYFKAAAFIVDGYWNPERQGNISSIELDENVLVIEYESDGLISTVKVSPLYRNFDFSIYSQLQFSGIEEDEGPFGVIRLESSIKSSNRPLPGLILIGDNLPSGHTLLPGLTIGDINTDSISLQTGIETRLVRPGESDVIAVNGRLYSIYLMDCFVPRAISDNDIVDHGRKSCDIMIVSYDYESDD